MKRFISITILLFLLSFLIRPDTQVSAATSAVCAVRPILKSSGTTMVGGIDYEKPATIEFTLNGYDGDVLDFTRNFEIVHSVNGSIWWDSYSKIENPIITKTGTGKYQLTLSIAQIKQIWGGYFNDPYYESVYDNAVSNKSWRKLIAIREYNGSKPLGLNSGVPGVPQYNDADRCVVEFGLYKHIESYEGGRCYEDYNNPPMTITCTKRNDGTIGYVKADAACNDDNAKRLCDAIISTDNLQNGDSLCVRCDIDPASITGNKNTATNHLDECQLEGVNCGTSNLVCKRYVSDTAPRCYYKSNIALGGGCIVGADECSETESNKGVICIGGSAGNYGTQASHWQIGSMGTCVALIANDGTPNIQYSGISCSVRSDCFDKALALGYPPNDQIDCEQSRCVFGDSELNDLNNPDRGNNNTPVSKPVPPHRFIEKCSGDLSCANCVARKKDNSTFASYNEAADLEYDYNQKVDDWLAARATGTDYDPPTTENEPFKYTGLIYTSLGCVDTTDNGLLTRAVQIALGITGAVILVRFGQAAMKLQGGGSPEDRAEGVEIISSAVVALLLFTMSIIGLRFLGINVLRVFSPGTVEFAPENP